MERGTKSQRRGFDPERRLPGEAQARRPGVQEYELHLRTDTHTAGNIQWFYFSATPPANAKFPLSVHSILTRRFAPRSLQNTLPTVGRILHDPIERIPHAQTLLPPLRLRRRLLQRRNGNLFHRPEETRPRQNQREVAQCYAVSGVQER